MIERWNKEIDKVTERFIKSFGSFTESQLNYKPDLNVWSSAQNISHLILLNNSYFQSFDEIKKGKHVLPPIDAMEDYVINCLRELRQYTRDDRTKRVNTWNKWQPFRDAIGLNILEDFANHQAVFKIHIQELWPFFLRPTFIKYPGESTLAFKLEDCINFLIEHENRHWKQAYEVKPVD